MSGVVVLAFLSISFTTQLCHGAPCETGCPETGGAVGSEGILPADIGRIGVENVNGFNGYSNNLGNFGRTGCGVNRGIGGFSRFANQEFIPGDLGLNGCIPDDYSGFGMEGITGLGGFQNEECTFGGAEAIIGMCGIENGEFIPGGLSGCEFGGANGLGAFQTEEILQGGGMKSDFGSLIGMEGIGSEGLIGAFGSDTDCVANDGPFWAECFNKHGFDGDEETCTQLDEACTGLNPYFRNMIMTV